MGFSRLHWESMPTLYILTMKWNSWLFHLLLLASLNFPTVFRVSLPFTPYHFPYLSGHISSFSNYFYKMFLPPPYLYLLIFHRSMNSGGYGEPISGAQVQQRWFRHGFLRPGQKASRVGYYHVVRPAEDAIVTLQGKMPTPSLRTTAVTSRSFAQLASWRWSPMHVHTHFKR